jgi:hypothetical protein
MIPSMEMVRELATCGRACLCSLHIRTDPRDDRQFVSPLIDVVDRGRPTQLVLGSAEANRLLHWQAGRVEQPSLSAPWSRRSPPPTHCHARRCRTPGTDIQPYRSSSA